MPYETIWEDGGACQRFSGQLSSADRERAKNDIMGSSLFDSMKYWIVDSLAIETYLLEKKDAVLAAGFDLGAERINGNVLMAFVATNTDHRDNISHYKKFLEGSGSRWKTELFDDIDSARQWISETLEQKVSV